LSRLAWSVTSLSPTRQGELLATQNPDGSLVFSVVLKDEQGLLSFLLVPPSPHALHADNVTQGKTCLPRRFGPMGPGVIASRRRARLVRRSRAAGCRFRAMRQTWRYSVTGLVE
jgi:hypothetical protein